MEKVHYKWQFSIAMLVYQRVTGAGIRNGPQYCTMFWGDEHPRVRERTAGNHGLFVWPFAG